jgi:hypothetical protein
MELVNRIADFQYSRLPGESGRGGRRKLSAECVEDGEISATTTSRPRLCGNDEECWSTTSERSKIHLFLLRFVFSCKGAEALRGDKETGRLGEEERGRQGKGAGGGCRRSVLRMERFLRQPPPSPSVRGDEGRSIACGVQQRAMCTLMRCVVADEVAQYQAENGSGGVELVGKEGHLTCDKMPLN